MESLSQPPLPLGLADNQGIRPGSSPLRNAKRERYARARVLGLSPIAAAAEAGYAPGQRGQASKLEGSAKVRDRIRYLANESDEVLRSKRARIEARMWQIMDASITDYTRITAGGGLVLDASPIAELPEDEQRELMGVVKKVAQTKYGPSIELHDPLVAAAQLRALNGLDAPKRVEMSGPEGGPIETQDVSARELIAGRIARLAPAAATSSDT